MPRRFHFVIFAGCLMLTLCSCGEDSRPSERIPVAEVTQNTTEITTVAETAGYMTSVSTEETLSQTDLTGVGTSDSDESLTMALQKQLAEWDDGNVEILIEINAGGQTVSEHIIRNQDNVYMETDMLGYRSTMISDGKYSYMLVPDQKIFSKTELPLFDDEETMENFLEDAELEDYIGKGREDLEGMKTLFEEFIQEDGAGLKEHIKYYYDDAGNLIGCKIIDSDGTVVMDARYTITFTDSQDDSVFAIPEGYTEVTYEEMLMSRMNALISSASEIVGELNQDAE